MSHLAFADDLLLVGKTSAEVGIAIEDMVDACGKWRMAIRPDKLRLWCTHERVGVRIGGHFMHPAASRELLVAILGDDWITEVWAKLCSLTKMLCSRTLGNDMRLQRLCTEVVAVLLWGCAAWDLKTKALRMAGVAIVRMGRIILQLRETEEEPLLQRQNGTLNESKSAIATAWGCTPVAVVAACAALMVIRLKPGPLAAK